MKRARENSLRWLRQAGHNFEITREHFINNNYSDTCFMAEQTAQIALKAFLYFNGERFVPAHSVTGLIKRCSDLSEDFIPLFKGAAKLTQYYIPTRYPDALGDDVIPAEVYTREQAEEAINIAREILELVKSKVK